MRPTNIVFIRIRDVKKFHVLFWIAIGIVVWQEERPTELFRNIRFVWHNFFYT